MSNKSTYAKGLLSLTYHLSYTPSIQQQAIEDFNQVMNDFELDQKQKEVIAEFQNNGFSSDGYAAYCVELEPEIRQNIAYVW